MFSSPHSRRRSTPTRAGRALATLALGLAVTLGLLVWASGLSAPGKTPLGPRPQLAESDVKPLAPVSLSGLSPRQGTPASRPDFEKSFRGSGRISVTVDVPGEVEFPPQWTLVLDRALFLEGEEHARPQRFDFVTEEQTIERRGLRPSIEVELDDVPFGGYSVTVEAPDMNATRQEVVLFAVKNRPDLPGRTHARITVRMDPAGFLDGRVVDKDGNPLEGCPLRLINRRSREVQEATSQATGMYVFPSVLDGSYRLEAGYPEAVLESRDLLYKKGQSTLEPLVLPSMSSVKFYVSDELSEAVPNALVEGYGSQGGNISVRTDLYGEAYATFLPPGKYRMRVMHPTGRRGKVDFTLEAGQTDRLVECVVRP